MTDPLPVIMETDIGRDPDDVFALLYLVQAGCDLRAITVSPGDADQIALVRWLLARIGLSHIPVGRARDLPDKRSLSDPHLQMLQRDSAALLADADGLGADIIEQALAECPSATLFACGPLKNLGVFLSRRVAANAPPLETRITMQGGFLSYRLAEELGFHLTHRLEKFEGQETVATFNLGNEKRGAELLLTHTRMPSFIGKNICHTLSYLPEHHARLRANSEVMRLWKHLMDGYLAEHPAKAMHDVTAAVGHVHPELFQFYAGELYREKGEYGTRPCDPPRHKIAIDTDRDAIWTAILEGH